MSGPVEGRLYLGYVVGTYNYWLVAASFGVAILTSYTAVDLAARVRSNRGMAKVNWLVGGAGAMGSGIWCMHYIGMLAFRLPMVVYYHVPTVALSLLAAVLSALIALYVVSLKRMSLIHTGIGSLLMGAGIAAMHYIGMAAMRMSAMHEYRAGLWWLSIALAVAISFVGLHLIFYLHKNDHSIKLRLAIALILGMAIPIMHYTGMAACSFRAMPEAPDLRHSIGISALAAFAIFGVTGVVLGLALLTSLVDRRMSVQQESIENERKMLRAMIDHIPDRLYVKDTEGRFLVANVVVAANFGCEDPQAVIGKSDRDYYPEQLASTYNEDERKVLEYGVSLVEFEETTTDADGNPVHLLSTKVPLRDKDGKIFGLAGIGRDIGDRKKYEDALRVAEQRYRSMFDDALAGIFQLGPGGHVAHANPAMLELMGYSSAEEMQSVLKGPLWESAASREVLEEFLGRLRATGSLKGYELEVMRRDGEKIWISCSLRMKKQEGDNEDALAGYVGIFEDITERRQLREQLLQAQKLESVGQLAAGIAHEINTPVQYVGDNVRFLKDSFEDLLAMHAEYGRALEAASGGTMSPELLALTKIAGSVDTDYLMTEIPIAIEQTLEGIARVSSLVGAMKEFSHSGCGEKFPLDINHAIESTATVARHEWRYIADMELELDRSLPPVPCLPGELGQVILNLIVNAAHAIDDASGSHSGKGVIRIKTQKVAEWVEIRIADTGTGIPEKARPRIFDPFFTTKEIGKGTGQGLAIARSIVVDKHQGTIDFETKTGQGTTFILRLPLAAAAIDTQLPAVA